MFNCYLTTFNQLNVDKYCKIQFCLNENNKSRLLHRLRFLNFQNFVISNFDFKYFNFCIARDIETFFFIDD